MTARSKRNESAAAAPPPLIGKPKRRKRATPSAVKRALMEAGGVVQTVAEAFGVTRQTVYNWINEWQLHDVLDRTREAMFTMAEDNIRAAVEAGNLDMSKFVLTHMPVVSSRRWSNRTELTGADGAPLGLSEDVIKLLAERNLNPSDVVREFEQMIRETARQESP